MLSQRNHIVLRKEKEKKNNSKKMDQGSKTHSEQY
jgi:hypothetical protein